MATPDNLLTRDQAAAVCGVTVRTLSRYASRSDSPLVPAQAGGHGKPTLYDPATVGEWLQAETLRKLEQQAGHQDAIDFHHERARLTRAQAEGQELKNRVARGEYAKVELLLFAVAKIASQVNAALGALPMKIKRLQPKLSASEIRAIQSEIVNLQNAVADSEIDWSEAPTDD